MSKVRRNLSYLLISLIIVATADVFSQSTSLGEKEINKLIVSTSKLFKKYYVSEEVGIKIGNVLKSNYQKGAYNNKEPKELATKLTADMQSVNGDKHISIHYSPIKNSEHKEKPHKGIEKVNTSGKWTNYGFQEVKILEGNIGYLKITHFSTWAFFKESKEVITSVFKMLENTDALIIDVMDNRGGYEDIIAYLISYLYDSKPIHLSDYYVRYNDSKESLWTNPKVPGKKLSKTPVYVLVNGYSASAAESLAYMLKHLKRAKIIGETTMGAGHGAMTHQATDMFKVTISSEETINVITKTSFEGIGVQPDIKVASEKAFSRAYKLALENLKNKEMNTISTSNYDDVLSFLSEENNNIINTDIYIGTYKNANIEVNISTRGGILFAKITTGKGLLKLIPLKRHIFKVENMKERMQFNVDQYNNIIELVGLDTPMRLQKVKP